MAWTGTSAYRVDDAGRLWRLHTETGTRDYHEQWQPVLPPAVTPYGCATCCVCDGPTAYVVRETTGELLPHCAECTGDVLARFDLAFYPVGHN